MLAKLVKSNMNKKPATRAVLENSIPRKLETKYAPLTVSTLRTEGAFEGYASLFNEVDSAKDTVAPGAFVASLKARRPAQIKMLFQHDPKEIVGVWDEIFEDQKGLKVKGRLLTNLQRGAELHSLMQEGALDGLSIGFRAAASRTDTKTGIRHIARIDLFEISLVTFPMLNSARIGSVKSGKPTMRQIERLLTREAGMTRTQARAVTRDGFKALDLTPARDARHDDVNAAFAVRIRNAAKSLCPSQEKPFK